MPSNFEYLITQKEYALFANACTEAERVFASSPAMCAVGCRKALELAVKWVYAADRSIEMPYKDNLQSLIHEASFRYVVVYDTWKKMPFVIKLGNLAVHTEKAISGSDAIQALRGLFEFVQWIDYCYGSDYRERRFDETIIPRQKVVVDIARIREQESLLSQKDSEIDALRLKIAALSQQYFRQIRSAEADEPPSGKAGSEHRGDQQRHHRSLLSERSDQSGVRQHLYGSSQKSAGNGHWHRQNPVLPRVLVDVLSRGGYITNVLFLADRPALVKQARDDFKNYLPHLSLRNLLSNREDKNARIVFSTYPTMLNAIDNEKNEDGQRLFTPAHFDLIVIDESHRSIFKKYRTIFDYFDAILVGLTATPRNDPDRSSYDFFEMELGVPTYAYDFETAVATDHVLVPSYNIETVTAFLEAGITYDDLSTVDKEHYEKDFTEDDGSLPELIPSPKINTFVFNEKTDDTVLQDLMANGIHVAGGDRIGKTIIFAQNKQHAEFILKRFNHLNCAKIFP